MTRQSYSRSLHARIRINISAIILYVWLKQNVTDETCTSGVSTKYRVRSGRCYRSSEIVARIDALRFSHPEFDLAKSASSEQTFPVTKTVGTRVTAHTGTRATLDHRSATTRRLCRYLFQCKFNKKSGAKCCLEGGSV